MKKHQFTTTIDAPKEKVWNVLWDKQSYETWTQAFAAGSTVETDNWREGSRIRFLDGKGAGMLSIVEVNRPNEFMSFKHIGMVVDGKEDTESEKVKAWSGAMENYTLTEKDGKTVLLVELDMEQQWEEYFQKTWPVALDKIKVLAER